jgi:hypothetical protein
MRNAGVGLVLILIGIVLFMLAFSSNVAAMAAVLTAPTASNAPQIFKVTG